MPDRTVFPISAHPQIGKIDEAEYFRLYGESVTEPDRFWAEQGRRLDWIKPYTKTRSGSFAGEVRLAWYEDGTLNASYNCIDRHLRDRADQTAILWEGDDPGEDRRVSYRELHEAVCRLANALRERGVAKGDRVTIYLPMIPEAAVAMLACARIGAIHSVVFGGFSPDSLAGRIRDCRSTVLITADEGRRGGRPVPLKRNADNALRHCPDVRDRRRRAPHRRGRSTGSRAAISGITKSAARPRPTARPPKWRPRTRSSSFTLRARPASPRAYCTRPAAISSMRR